MQHPPSPHGLLRSMIKWATDALELSGWTYWDTGTTPRTVAFSPLSEHHTHTYCSKREACSFGSLVSWMSIVTHKLPTVSVGSGRVYPSHTCFLGVSFVVVLGICISIYCQKYWANCALFISSFCIVTRKEGESLLFQSWRATILTIKSMLEVVVLALAVTLIGVDGLCKAFRKANRKLSSTTLQAWTAAVGLQPTGQGCLYLPSPGHRDGCFQLFLDGAEWGNTPKGNWEEICLYKIVVCLLM